jgi:hypothetical protein
MVNGPYDTITTIEEDQTLLVRIYPRAARDYGVTSAQSTAATMEAMDLTLRTLTDRLLLFRICCIAVGLVILLSLIGSVAYKIWLVLCGALALFALGGLFYCCDLARIKSWQQRILNLWVHDRLDLDAFSVTMSLTRNASQGLLRIMLSGLPTRSRGFSPMASNLRNATALTMRTLDWCRWDRMALLTLVFSIVLGSLAWAASTSSWRPVEGCLLVLLLLGVLPVSTDRRLRHWHRQIAPLLQQGVDRRDFAEVARRLDWGPIPSWQKDRWLQVVAQEPS